MKFENMINKVILGDCNDYLKLLKKYRKRLTRQQLLTLRGQILSGDIVGFKKGLSKINETIQRKRAL